MRSYWASSPIKAFASDSNQRRKRFCVSQVTATARPKREILAQPPSTSCERRSVSMSKKISRVRSGNRLGVVDIFIGEAAKQKLLFGGFGTLIVNQWVGIVETLCGEWNRLQPVPLFSYFCATRPISSSILRTNSGEISR